MLHNLTVPVYCNNHITILNFDWNIGCRTSGYMIVVNCGEY